MSEHEHGPSSRPKSDDERVKIGEHPTEDDSPLVSVVISTYNRPMYLERAVRSVGQQTYTPLELIVVDDHSDRPAECVLDGMDREGFHGVKILRHERNRGANAARNTGIEAASGKFIAFLDDDDRWRPKKIARQVAAADPETGVVYTGIVADRGAESEVEVPPEISGDITRALLCGNIVGSLSAVMVRTEVARSVTLDERFPAWADLEWYVRLSLATEFERVPEPLVVYDFDSKNRLSDDYKKKRRGYGLFVEKFDRVAAQYGRLFHRKFRAWAAFHIGSAALDCGRYGAARRSLARAVWMYPLEPMFTVYFCAAVGGRPTHEIARFIDEIVPI